MANVDDKVVAMSFENAKFETGVSQTLSTLDKLKAALKLEGASKGLDDLETKSGRISFGPLGDAVDTVGNKFSAMKVLAVAALATVATKAVSAGLQFAKSLTVEPITAGFHNYETQINAVQTILANTGLTGKKGLDQVNKSLGELNTYANKTVYNFSEMAKNIGTFTAAGVDLKTSTAAIKGIANLAALSGSNSQQASTAMYQLSQAISAGKVGLQDWNSVVNAGMGGTVFQRALAQTAEKMGTLKDGAVKLVGPMKNVSINGESFRQAITAKPGEKSWLTSDVLTSTLKQFTGDMTDAQLKAEGFNESEIQAIQKQAKVAVGAATNIKTLSQLMDALKEEVATAWGAIFKTLFGDINQATSLFSSLHTVIENAITGPINNFNKILEDWAKLGGRATAIEAFKNAFEALSAVVKPIKDAFREIFPPTTGAQLVDLTNKFEKFTEKLKIGPDTAENLKRTFAGLFAVLDIGKQIIFGVLGVLTSLIGAAGSGSGGFLKLTGSLGDSLVALDNWLKDGDRLKNFFKGLGTVLSAPITLLGRLKDVIAGLFDGINKSDAEKLGGIFDGLGEKFKPTLVVIDAMKKAWNGLVAAVTKIKDQLQPAIDSVVGVFNSFAQQLGDAIAHQNFDGVFKVIQTGLLGGILIAVKKALGGGLNINIGGEALKGLSASFEALTGNLKAMEANVKANTLLQIAAAVGVLAVAVVALSKVNAADLSKSMTAIAVGFGELVATMTLLQKGVGSGFAKMPLIAASLIELATALDILVIAVKALSGLSWEQLTKGLAGVGALLLELSIAVQPLSAASGKMVLVGAGLIALGVALNIIARAVETFGSMKWGEMGKGLLGVAGALTAIGVGLALIPPSVLLIGPGLIAVGIALNAISGAVAIFGSMDLKTLGKGLLGVAGSLVAIAAGIALMPPTMALQAAGLVLVGVALTEIAGAVALMGGMSIGTLAKGIIAIGAALVVLAAGLTLMIAALPGAAALAVAAVGLLAITPVIGMLGTMSWGTIGKGLAAIAAAMLVIGAAGAVAAPALVIAGAGLIALGAGISVVGAGLYLIAKAFAVFAADGNKSVAVVIAALTGLVAIVPTIVINFAKGLVQVVTEIAKLAPLVVDAIAKILGSLLDVIIKDAPKIADAFTALIQAGLTVLNDNVPNMIATGWTLLSALLKGVNDHIEEVTKTVISIVLKFLGTLTGKLGDLTRAGANALAALLQGIADNITKVVSAAGDIMASLLTGIIAQYAKVNKAGIDALAKFISGVGANVNTVISAGADLIINIIEGIGNKAKSIISAGATAISNFISGVAKEALKLGAEGGQAMINFMNGVSDWLDKHSGELGAAGGRMGGAIVKGAMSAVAGAAGGFISELEGVFGRALDAVKKKMHIKSPSRVFYDVGSNMMQGLRLGIRDDGQVAVSTLESSAEDMIQVMIDSISKVPDALAGLIDLDPVITPVLDLTKVQADAKKLTGLVDTAPVSTTVAYGQASSISSEQANQASSSMNDAPPPVTEIKFEQHNTSPEALSETEIYRSTKNLISQAKNVLQLA
jgi:tape measure domain-containing protein